jgi:hypothetical protein
MNNTPITKILSVEELAEYSIIVAEKDYYSPKARELRKKVMEYPQPDWDKYRGCNSIPINTPNRMFGMVSFTEHIGKPLSKSLWEDLVFRLGISGLWILQNQEEWCISCPCKIYLDEDGNVKDIRVSGLYV